MLARVPLRDDFRVLRKQGLWAEIPSSMALALLTVPQSMAYALVAGLPPTTGLLASIFGTFLVAFFGSSRQLVAGPSNGLAILLNAGTAQVLTAFYPDLVGDQRVAMALVVMSQLALGIGALQLLAAALRLGSLAQFVSHSVVVGYIFGVAIAVVINQSYTFFGLGLPNGQGSLFDKAQDIVAHVKDLHVPTTVLGTLCLLTLLGLKRFVPKWPVAVIACVVTTMVCHLIGMGELVDEQGRSVMLVRDTGGITQAFPAIVAPTFSFKMLNVMLPIVFAIALLGILETTSVGKSVSATTGQPYRVNQELFALGLANTVLAFIPSMPVSGSPSRTSLNLLSGAKTHFSAIFSSGIVALILFYFGNYVEMIPLSCLAALLFITAANLINLDQIQLCLWTTRSDAFVMLVTVTSCVFLSLDNAFFIGVVSSVTLYLKKAGNPGLIEYDVDESGELSTLESSSPKRHIRLINVEGELFFGAADLFQTTLRAISEDYSQMKVIILRLKDARDMDATSCLALRQIYHYLQRSDTHLILCGLTPPISRVLRSSGLERQIGKSQLFPLEERNPHASTQAALRRARELIGSEPDEHKERAIDVPAETSLNGVPLQ